MALRTTRRVAIERRAFQVDIALVRAEGKRKVRPLSNGPRVLTVWFLEPFANPSRWPRTTGPARTDSLAILDTSPSLLPCGLSVLRLTDSDTPAARSLALKPTSIARIHRLDSTQQWPTRTPPQSTAFLPARSPKAVRGPTPSATLEHLWHPVSHRRTGTQASACGYGPYGHHQWINSSLSLRCVLGAVICSRRSSSTSLVIHSQPFFRSVRDGGASDFFIASRTPVLVPLSRLSLASSLETGGGRGSFTRRCEALMSILCEPRVGGRWSWSLSPCS